MGREMAALLCKPCEALCEGCGWCFGRCSEACGECWKECCKGFEKCVQCACGECCHECCCSPSRPTPFYSTWAVAMGGAVIGLGATAAAADADGCSNNLMIYNILGLLMGLLHIFFALYYYFLFIKKAQEAAAEAGGEGQEGDFSKVNMSAEAYKIFMYDPWTALYILLYIFGFIWGILGISWSADDGCKNDAIKNDTKIVGILLLCYGIITPFVIFFGICLNNIRVELQKSAEKVESGNADPCTKCCIQPCLPGASCPLQLCALLCCCPCYVIGKVLLAKTGSGHGGEVHGHASMGNAGQVNYAQGPGDTYKGAPPVQASYAPGQNAA